MSLTTITRSKPFYVVAGATDVAVARLRDVPNKLSTVKIERRDLEKAAKKATKKTTPKKRST